MLTQDKKFLIGDAIKFGIATAKDNLVLILVMMLISLAAGSFFVIFNAVFVPHGSFFSIIVGVAYMLVLSGLYLGHFKICSDLYSHKVGSVSDMFLRFDVTLFKFFGASAIYVIISTLGSVALIVPGVYLSLRLQFYGAVLAESPKTKIIEAFKISWKITQGSTRNLFMLALAITGINILGFLALVVGLLFTAPISLLAMVYSYKKLSCGFGGCGNLSCSPLASTDQSEVIINLNKPKMKISS